MQLVPSFRAASATDNETEAAIAALEPVLSSPHPHLAAAAGLSLAHLHIVSGDHERALSVLDGLRNIKEEGFSDAITFAFADAHRSADNPNEAIAAYQGLIDDGGVTSRARALVSLAEIYREHHMLDTAIDFLRLATAMKDERWSPHACYLLGSALAELGDRDGAAEAFNRAADADYPNASTPAERRVDRGTPDDVSRLAS